MIINKEGKSRKPLWKTGGILMGARGGKDVRGGSKWVKIWRRSPDEGQAKADIDTYCAMPWI